MSKWTGKAKQAGLCLCLAALLLTGCGEKQEADTTVQDNKKASQQMEKPEVQVQANPDFIQDGIRSVILTKDGQEIFHLSKEPAEYKMEFDYWEILNPYDEILTVNTEEMYNLFDALCAFDFQTPVELDEGTETGIAESETSIALEFVGTQDMEKAKSTTYADSAAEIILGKEDGEGNRFVAVKGFEDQIYKLPSAELDAIYALNPYSYILKIPALINIDTVEQVELSLGKKTYEMNVDTAENQYKFGKKNVEKETFTELYQALASVMLAGEVEEGQSLEKETPILTVTYHRNMDTAPEVTIAYYAYDDTHDLVEINDTQRFLVKKADVEALAEQIQDAF